VLGGLVRPSGGQLAPPLHRWRARAVAGFVGSVFQDPEHQFLARTVADELELGPLRLGSSPAVARQRRDELLARLHLERLAEANPFTLSGGEQRRLSVGTALATRPQLLVLDEPTFGQDARTWLELLDLLAGLRDDGAALLAVTHDEAFAEALADRTVVLGRAQAAPAGAGGRRRVGTSDGAGAAIEGGAVHGAGAEGSAAATVLS
jgi:energy-coupling factor transport system ATP-binding protein